MNGIGTWQACQYRLKAVAAGETESLGFVVDGDLHAVMSIRFTLLTTNLNTLVAMGDMSIKLDVEGEQLFGGDFVNIRAICKPTSHYGDACAWELILPRAISVTKNLNIKIEIENTHPSVDKDVAVAFFGLAVEN